MGGRQRERETGERERREAAKGDREEVGKSHMPQLSIRAACVQRGLHVSMTRGEQGYHC